MVMASVGQASAHARQPSRHLGRSMTGSPRKRSGSVGAWAGYAIVRCPCFRRQGRRAAFVLQVAAAVLVARSRGERRRTLQVVAAVRQVEALVAQRKVGNLLVAQRHRQAGPVVERRIDDLVAGEPPLGVGQRDVADLAAPAFDQRDGQVIPASKGRRRRESARRAGPASCSRMNATERWISSQRTYARAKTSPVVQVETGTWAKRKMPAGKVLAHVALDAAGPGRRADHTQGQACVARDRPGPLEAGLHRRRVPEQVGRVGDVAVGRVQPLQELLDVRLRPDRSRRRPAGSGRGRSDCRTAGPSG